MFSQLLPPPLSPPSAKLMIMALEEYGYQSRRGIRLSNKELVSGLPKIAYAKDKLCSACEMGKQHKGSFKFKQSFSITEPLHMLHMDLFGPISTSSLGGKKYTVVLVDEFTRFTWVIFLKAKSEAAHEIISFIKQEELQKGKSIKQLRSDHGTEFRNSTLEGFCEEKGIIQNFSSVRTPQQNGVVERRNRTLIEAARTMLYEAKLKLSFWAEALHKLEPKADQGIFVGYSSISKAYRVYNAKRRVIEESMHVTFDETSIDRSDKPQADLVSLSELERNEEDLTSKPMYVMENSDVEYDGEADKTNPFKETINIEDDQPNTSKSAQADIFQEIDHQPENLGESSGINQIENLGDFSIPTQTEVVSPIQPEEYYSDPNSEPQSPTTTFKVLKDHPLDNVISDVEDGVLTRSKATANYAAYSSFLSQMEPKKTEDALKDEDWIEAMQEELTEFQRNKEEVYVKQPPGFVDAKHPDYVYKLDKALYGLKQAPRACLCDWFSKIMSQQYRMSMMREMTYFLGLQIQQKKNGIFINQSKYVFDLIKKYGLESSHPVKSPMSYNVKLHKDIEGKSVCQTTYRGMIGSLLYLTASRPDIMFATCVCVRYQADPKESHLQAVKRILKYLKGTPNLGNWYPKDSGFDLVGYSDLDFAGCGLDRKSTTGGCQLLGGKLVSWTAELKLSILKLDIVEKGKVDLIFIETEDQLVDIFTKPIEGTRFTTLLVKLGMLNP
ncbi:retrovirus-related pol polyprotein from transposon TNT 1-94 [Tanacetum coccineum]|uniref:Retrovirus-related pol polyprotein from transposon TNT 1-94 n=1 Tax=Tanacetum coccineum TaxID=301880 RepID=A0ABQ5IY80_9ASTR